MRAGAWELGAQEKQGWGRGEKAPPEVGEGSGSAGSLDSWLHGLGEVPLESGVLDVEPLGNDFSRNL